MPYSCKSYANAQELHWESRAQIHWQVWFTALHMLAVNGPDCVLGSCLPENWCRLPPPHMKHLHSGDCGAKQSFRKHKWGVNCSLAIKWKPASFFSKHRYKNYFIQIFIFIRVTLRITLWECTCVGCGTIYLCLMKTYNRLNPWHDCPSGKILCFL